MKYFLAIILILFVSGCVQQTTPSEKQVQYKDSSNFLLSLPDLPSNKNWTIQERGERNVNDVTAEALEFNWSGGYYIHFTSSENDKVNYLEQYLSIYPEEKILGSLNLDYPGYEPLSNPSIGEHSRAFKGRTSNNGKEFEFYNIEFVKNNVLVNLYSYGANTDYIKLKELAQKAYDKIDGYGKPFDKQMLQPTSKTYTNSLYGFSIVQPSGWNVNQDTSSIVQFDSPKTSGKSASILVNVYDSNINWFDTEENRNIFIDSLKQGVSNFVLLKDISMTINGKKAYSFSFVNTISTGENRAAQQVYIERNDKQVFTISYVADSKQFETYRDVFTNTLNSFKQN